MSTGDPGTTPTCGGSWRRSGPRPPSGSARSSASSRAPSRRPPRAPPTTSTTPRAPRRPSSGSRSPPCWSRCGSGRRRSTWPCGGSGNRGSGCASGAGVPSPPAASPRGRGPRRASSAPGGCGARAPRPCPRLFPHPRTTHGDTHRDTHGTPTWSEPWVSPARRPHDVERTPTGVPRPLLHRCGRSPAAPSVGAACARPGSASSRAPHPALAPVRPQPGPDVRTPRVRPGQAAAVLGSGVATGLASVAVAGLATALVVAVPPSSPAPPDAPAPRDGSDRAVVDVAGRPAPGRPHVRRRGALRGRAPRRGPGRRRGPGGRRRGGRGHVRGAVAGRGVVVVAHPDGLRTTYEPLDAAVRPGQAVTAGTPLGRWPRSPCTAPPRACTSGCAAARRTSTPVPAAGDATGPAPPGRP